MYIYRPQKKYMYIYIYIYPGARSRMWTRQSDSRKPDLFSISFALSSSIGLLKKVGPKKDCQVRIGDKRQSHWECVPVGQKKDYHAQMGNRTRSLTLAVCAAALLSNPAAWWKECKHLDLMQQTAKRSTWKPVMTYYFWAKSPA